MDDTGLLFQTELKLWFCLAKMYAFSCICLLWQILQSPQKTFSRQVIIINKFPSLLVWNSNHLDAESERKPLYKENSWRNLLLLVFFHWKERKGWLDWAFTVSLVEPFQSYSGNNRRRIISATETSWKLLGKFQKIQRRAMVRSSSSSMLFNLQKIQTEWTASFNRSSVHLLVLLSILLYK